MSQYPNNPLWCQNHDRPIAIVSIADWEQADADGHLTPEHVLQRIHDIAEFEFGNGEELGFDGDGFLVSLAADGMQLPGGVTLSVYPNDHPPPHVHVRIRALPHVKLRISLETGEPLDDGLPDGWSKKLKRIQRLVADNAPTLASWWEKHHGEAVAFG
jgi:hypothetical protein